MKTTHYIIVAILVIIVGTGGFYGGVKYQESKTPSFRRSSETGNFPRQTGQRAGASMTRGEIIDRDDESITVKQTDGSTKIILLSGDTSINKAQEGKIEDLEKGAQVAIFGQENSDKSITASNIQLNPEEFRGRFNITPQVESRVR